MLKIAHKHPLAYWNLYPLLTEGLVLGVRNLNNETNSLCSAIGRKYDLCKCNDCEGIMHVFNWFNCGFVLLYYVYVLGILGIVLKGNKNGPKYIL